MIVSDEESEMGAKTRKGSRKKKRKFIGVEECGVRCMVYNSMDDYIGGMHLTIH